jgi:exodeoxyribonuclease V alpha subunit
VWTRGKETSSGIFNGDIGKIIAINHNASFMKIDFDSRIAIYPFENISELELAYAITVHKSQGSEFEAVILPVAEVPAKLCYRNLLYTGVTRAKKLLILLGQPAVLGAMVRNDRRILRYSCFCDLLQDEALG